MIGTDDRKVVRIVFFTITARIAEGLSFVWIHRNISPGSAETGGQASVGMLVMARTLDSPDPDRTTR